MCPGHLSPITYERFKCNTEVKSEKCNLARDTSCYALESIQIFFVGIRHQRESNWHCLRFVWILGPVCQRRNRDAACWSPSTLSFHPQSGWKHARASFLLRGSFCGLESTSAVLTAWFFFFLYALSSFRFALNICSWLSIQSWYLLKVAETLQTNQATTAFSAFSAVDSRLDEGSSRICGDFLLFAQNLEESLTKRGRHQKHPKTMGSSWMIQ